MKLFTDFEIDIDYDGKCNRFELLGMFNYHEEDDKFKYTIHELCKWMHKRATFRGRTSEERERLRNITDDDIIVMAHEFRVSGAVVILGDEGDRMTYRPVDKFKYINSYDSPSGAPEAYEKFCDDYKDYYERFEYDQVGVKKREYDPLGRFK